MNTTRNVSVLWTNMQETGYLCYSYLSIDSSLSWWRFRCSCGSARPLVTTHDDRPMLNASVIMTGGKKLKIKAPLVIKIWLSEVIWIFIISQKINTYWYSSVIMQTFIFTFAATQIIPSVFDFSSNLKFNIHVHHCCVPGCLLCKNAHYK